MSNGFHSTILMQALRMGLLSDKQKRARAGRLLEELPCFFALGVLLTFSLGERSYRWGGGGAHSLGSLGLSRSIDCSLPRQDSLLGAIRLSWSFTRKRESGASCIVCFVRVVRLLLPLMLHFFHHHHHHHPRTFIERLTCAGHCAGRGAGEERVRGLRVGRSRDPCPYSRFSRGWGGTGTDNRK